MILYFYLVFLCVKLYVELLRIATEIYIIRVTCILQVFRTILSVVQMKNVEINKCKKSVACLNYSPISPQTELCIHKENLDEHQK